jgi:[acyl-carrier-protein] S-malonyltransferase
MLEMSKTAFVFPGQGTQTVGMVSAWLETSPEMSDILAVFNDAAGHDGDGRCLADVLRDGPEDVLKQTRWAQPAIVCASVMALASVQKAYPEVVAAVVAGHSLGEFVALYAAKVISLETLACLIAARAKAMQDTPSGTMAVVLGLNATLVREILSTLEKTLSPDEVVVLANDNCPDQQVISGTPEAIAQAGEAMKVAGAKRVLPLPVSGAFHSPLMEGANIRFKETLLSTPFAEASIPVVSNVDAKSTTEGMLLREKLSRQIPGSVLWTDTLKQFQTMGIETVIELGPGKVLSGLAKKTMAPTTVLLSVSDPVSLTAAQEVLLTAPAVL